MRREQVRSLSQQSVLSGDVYKDDIIVSVNGSVCFFINFNLPAS